MESFKQKMSIAFCYPHRRASLNIIQLYTAAYFCVKRRVLKIPFRVVMDIQWNNVALALQYLKHSHGVLCRSFFKNPSTHFTLFFVSVTMCVGKVFSGAGALGDFPKFFQGEAKNSEICFLPLKTKKTTFFAKILNSNGGPRPPATPPFRRPCL